MFSDCHQKSGPRPIVIRISNAYQRNIFFLCNGIVFGQERVFVTLDYSPEEREIRNKLKPMHQETRTKSMKPKWKGMKLIVN